MPLNSSRRDHFCLRYLLVYREHKMRTHKIYFWWLRRNIFIETDLFECFKNHLWALLLLDPSKSKRSPIKTQKIFFLINLLFLCANGTCERKSLFVFLYTCDDDENFENKQARKMRKMKTWMRMYVEQQTVVAGRHYVWEGKRLELNLFFM